MIKNTGKKKDKDSEDKNFFKIQFYEMAAMFFDKSLMKMQSKKPKMKASSIPGQVLGA